jgi:putative SOS response-associated peptidase YedK
MCGRYTIYTDAAALAARFHAYVPPGLLAPSYNAAPSQGLPTILHANPYVITVSAWGFRPAWADWRDVTPVINARAETVATKPFFRAFRPSCLVWQTVLRMAAHEQGQGALPWICSHTQDTCGKQVLPSQRLYVKEHQS